MQSARNTPLPPRTPSQHRSRHAESTASPSQILPVPPLRRGHLVTQLRRHSLMSTMPSPAVTTARLSWPWPHGHGHRHGTKKAARRQLKFSFRITFHHASARKKPWIMSCSSLRSTGVKILLQDRQPPCEAPILGSDLQCLRQICWVFLPGSAGSHHLASRRILCPRCLSPSCVQALSGVHALSYNLMQHLALNPIRSPALNPCSAMHLIPCTALLPQSQVPAGSSSGNSNTHPPAMRTGKLPRSRRCPQIRCLILHRPVP